MKTQLLAILLISTIWCHAQTQLLYTRIIEVNVDVKPTQRTEDSVKVYKATYLDMELRLSSDNKTYIVQKDIEKITTGHIKILRVTDKQGEPIKFNNSMEFLNYMDERGYGVLEQKEIHRAYQSGWEYTFKKK